MIHSDKCIKATQERKEVHDAWMEKWPNACTSCGGAAGDYYSYDPSPFGVSLSSGQMTDFDTCQKCIEEGICGRCGKKQTFDDPDDSCYNCGWMQGNGEGDACPPKHLDDMCPCEYELYQSEDMDFLNEKT